MIFSDIVNSSLGKYLENKVDVGFGEYVEVRYKRERSLGLLSMSFCDFLVIKPKNFSGISFPMCF